jgi:hypothetical protein
VTRRFAANSPQIPVRLIQKSLCHVRPSELNDKVTLNWFGITPHATPAWDRPWRRAWQAPHGHEGNRGKNEWRRYEHERIPRLDAEEEGGQEASKAEGCSDADNNPDKGQPHAVSHDELAYPVAMGTEGHADAHLLGALRDGIGHQAVYANGGEKQRRTSSAASY